MRSGVGARGAGCHFAAVPGPWVHSSFPLAVLEAKKQTQLASASSFLRTSPNSIASLLANGHMEL